jgi:hypothetical protein
VHFPIRKIINLLLFPSTKLIKWRISSRNIWLRSSLLVHIYFFRFIHLLNFHVAAGVIPKRTPSLQVISGHVGRSAVIIQMQVAGNAFFEVNDDFCKILNQFQSVALPVTANNPEGRQITSADNQTDGISHTTHPKCMVCRIRFR